MRYPCLVPKKLCRTPIKIIIFGEDLTEDGSPVEVHNAEHKCNYQDAAKTVFTEDKKQVQLSGIALFHGDIAPDLPTLSGGKAVVFDCERTIHQGSKKRNPDGTVNYTRLELI